jgi:citrate lyase subunit beta/citryl-CoA lyase
MTATRGAPARSYLFVPGNRPERFDKARASGADVVVIDLEDAVAADDKSRARAAIVDWLRPERPVALRINGASTPWFAADLELCRRAGVAAVLLPKAEHPDEISAVVSAAVAAAAGHATAVLPIIETALGIERLGAIAAAARVQRLAFGTLDFRVDLGMSSDGSDDEDELAYFRSRLALASRVAGLQAPVDGVTTAIDDAARIEADTRRARRFGFGGKLCIHPKQLAAIHRGFAPTEQQVDWARRVLEAVRTSGGSAVQVDGKMVDQPVILQAQSIVADGERTG